MSPRPKPIVRQFPGLELIGEEIEEVARGAGEPVREVVLERRGTDRRVTDHLAEARTSAGLTGATTD